MSANTAVPQTTPAQVHVEEAVIAGQKRKPEEVTNEKNQKPRLESVATTQRDAPPVSAANPVLSTAVNPTITAGVNPATAATVNPGLASAINPPVSHPFFDDSKFILVKNVEIKEIDGSWRSAQIYARKEDPSIVTLFFGSTEYEGLDGDYKMGPDGKIYDGDGDVIQYRTAINQFDAARALSSSAAAANATARVQQQQQHHYQQLHPQHQQVQPQQIPQQQQPQQQQSQQQPQHQNAAAIGMPVPVTIAAQRGVPMMLNAAADKNTEKWHLLELQDALDGVMESRFCVGGEWQLEQPIVVTCHQPKGASTDAANPKVVQTLQFPMSAQDVKQLEMHPFIRSLHAPRAALESQFKQSLPSNCFDVNIDLAVSSSAPASSSSASSSGPYRHFSSSILQRIHTSLVPEAHLLRAELQHMSWRNPGFKQTTFAHQTRESLKGQLANPHNTFVGVLELVLPAPFQGGALRIRHQQREKQFLYPAFDPAQATATGASHFIPRNCIAWTAFFGEACFCVSPIVEDETQHNGGSRVSLIYFLFRESHPPPDPYVDHLLLRVHMLQEQLRQALQSPNFFPAGGRLHLRMRHLYDERHIAVTEEKMLVCFRESSGPVSIQGIRLKDEDAVLAVIFSAFHLDVSISRLLEIEVDENSRRQQRVRCKEKGESFQDPLDDDTLWILPSLPRTSNSRSVARKNSIGNRKEEERKVFGKLRRASHGGYSLMSVTHAEINEFASHEIKRSEHTWIGTYAIPHKWFADRAYGEVITVEVPADVHPSGKVEMISESALDASFLTSTSFCVHIPAADKRASIVNLGAPALSSTLIRRKKARKKKKKEPERTPKGGLPRRGRLQMSLGSSKPCVQASAVRAPSISGSTVPTVDAALHEGRAPFPMESLVAEAAKHAKAFPKASKTTSLPTGVFSSSHHGIKLTDNDAQRYCVRISIGGKQFRLGTTYADVESARKMYLAARRVLVRVANGRLALNEERLDKELNHVTIHIYRTKSDNMPTTVLMKDYLRNWISTQQPLTPRRRRRKKGPARSLGADQPIAASPGVPQPPNFQMPHHMPQMPPHIPAIPQMVTQQHTIQQPVLQHPHQTIMTPQASSSSQIPSMSQQMVQTQQMQQMQQMQMQQMRLQQQHQHVTQQHAAEQLAARQLAAQHHPGTQQIHHHQLQQLQHHQMAQPQVTQTVAIQSAHQNLAAVQKPTQTTHQV